MVGHTKKTADIADVFAWRQVDKSGDLVGIWMNVAAVEVDDVSTEANFGLTKAPLLMIEGDACVSETAYDSEKSLTVLVRGVTRIEYVVHHDNDPFAACDEGGHMLLEVLWC